MSKKRKAGVPAMRKNPAQHPPGTIILPCSDMVDPNIVAQVWAVKRPPGTALMVQIGHDVASGLNAAFDDPDFDAAAGEWAWILNDDMVFPADALLRLLDHERDIVGPICRARRAPFPLVCAGLNTESEGVRHAHPDRLPPTGLAEVSATGGAGLLIRRRVWETLEHPLWQFVSSHGRDGQVPQGEDYNFCDKARAAGFQIFADCSLPFGHNGGSVTIWPVYDDGAWRIELRYGNAFVERLADPPCSCS